jgi:hypothetical protein
MKCFECWQLGTRSDAVAVCHHCSAAVCSEHARVVDDPVQALYPVAKTVVLPIHARLILCETCRTAITQHHGKRAAVELQTA